MKQHHSEQQLWHKKESSFKLDCMQVSDKILIPYDPHTDRHLSYFLNRRLNHISQPKITLTNSQLHYENEYSKLANRPKCEFPLIQQIQLQLMKQKKNITPDEEIMRVYATRDRIETKYSRSLSNSKLRKQIIPNQKSLDKDKFKQFLSLIKEQVGK